MNLGGRYKTDFGTIKMVQALHSCGVPGGIPCGFIIPSKEGPTVYYAGDTALFGDMKLFGEMFDIDYAILPIGDNYTMGPDDALLAAKFLKAKHVIPLSLQYLARHRAGSGGICGKGQGRGHRRHRREARREYRTVSSKAYRQKKGEC